MEGGGFEGVGWVKENDGGLGGVFCLGKGWGNGGKREWKEMKK